MREWFACALRRIADWFAPLRQAPPPVVALPDEPGAQTRLARELAVQFEESRQIALEMIAAERASRPQTPDQIEHDAQRERFANKTKKSPKRAERF